MNKIYLHIFLLFTIICPLRAQIIFTKSFGTFQNSESAVSMVRTADNGYVLLGGIGSGLNDLFIVKTDSAGNQLWSKTITDSTHHYYPEKITELPGGDLIIVGRKQLTTIIFWNNFILKTDPAGNIIWENSYFPLFDYQTLRSVKTTSDGNFIVTGSCQNATGFSHTPVTAKLDTAGSVIWSNFNGDFETYDITELADGTFVCSGYDCSICTAGSSNAMVAKYTAGGGSMWIQVHGTAGYNDAWHFISTTLSGDLIVCGTVDTFYNPAIGLRNTNIIVAKLDTAGTIIWNSEVYFPYRDLAGEIVETADSTFHLAATVQNVFHGNPTYSNETAHLQFDQGGNLLCHNYFNPRYSSGSSIVLSDDQKLMIAGYIQRDTMLSSNMMLQKLEPACCVSPAPFNIQAPDSTICPGDTFILTTNQQSNTTIQWWEGGGLTPLGSNDSLQIPPPTFGGDFYAVVEGQCGVTYSTILKIKSGSITTSVLLHLISPSSAVCVGDSVLLQSVFPQTGITLPHWVHNGVEIGQGPGYLWVKDSGEYWMTAYTRCDTIYSDTIYVTIVTGSPTVPSIAASDSTLCGGTATVMLSTAPCNGCVYHWYDETGAYTETDSAFHTVSVAHTYTVTVVNPCDSASSPDSVVIQNGSLPALPVITQSDDTLLSSYVSGNQWYFNSVVIPGATGSFYIPQQNGIYSVSYTENGCTVLSAGFNFTITSLPDNFSGNAFQVLQQDNGTIHIKTTGKNPLQSLRLYSMDGKRLMVLENLHSYAYKLTISSDLSEGIYFMELYNGKETTTVKLFLKE